MGSGLLCLLGTRHQVRRAQRDPLCCRLYELYIIFICMAHTHGLYPDIDGRQHRSRSIAAIDLCAACARVERATPLPQRSAIAVVGASTSLVCGSCGPALDISQISIEVCAPITRGLRLRRPRGSCYAVSRLARHTRGLTAVKPFTRVPSTPMQLLQPSDQLWPSPFASHSALETSQSQRCASLS